MCILQAAVAAAGGAAAEGGVRPAGAAGVASGAAREVAAALGAGAAAAADAASAVAAVVAAAGGDIEWTPICGRVLRDGPSGGNCQEIHIFAWHCHDGSTLKAPLQTLTGGHFGLVVDKGHSPGVHAELRCGYQS